MTPKPTGKVKLTKPMKKTQRKKPKFKVGQVVTMAEETEGYLFRLGEVFKASRGEHQYWDLGAGFWHDESELRPLTKRERGQ